MNAVLRVLSKSYRGNYIFIISAIDQLTQFSQLSCEACARAVLMCTYRKEKHSRSTQERSIERSFGLLAWNLWLYYFHSVPSLNYNWNFEEIYFNSYAFRRLEEHRTETIVNNEIIFYEWNTVQGIHNNGVHRYATITKRKMTFFLCSSLSKISFHLFPPVNN